MKNYIAAIIFLFSLSASAQYGYGDPNRGGGVDRSLTGQQYGNKHKKKTTEKFDPVEQSMKKLNEALTLDSFQEAAIRELLNDNQAAETKVLSEDEPDEAKLEKIIALREKLNGKIKNILTPAQNVKFEGLMDPKKKK